MGLDTVELIIEFEKYFQIQIEDKEAEQAATINDVVKLVCYKKGVVSKSCNIYNQFSIYLLQELQLLYPSLAYLKDSDNILTIIPLQDKTIVKSISQNVGLFIEPYDPFTFPTWHKLFKKPIEYYLSLKNFKEAIAILNLIELYPEAKFSNEMAIYLAVAQISYYKSGVNIYEIGRNKSFTNDLGMD